MRQRARLSFLLVLVLVPALARAEITVRASLDPPRVGVGESADLAVQIGGAQDAPAPAIATLEGLQIRYVGPTTQLSIVQGRTNSSITHHFSVTAARPGTFTIGPLAVDYGGKRYDAGSVTLEARAAGAPPPGDVAAAAGGARGTAATDRLRLELSLPRTSVYLRERLPLTVRLLVGNISVTDVEYPTIPGEGFALEKFPEPTQHREQTPQGPAQVVDFATALTPLRSGELAVGPARLKLSVQAPSRRGRDPFFEQFFGRDPFGSWRPLTLESAPLTLTVLPLPETGRPADFSGAVGDFAFAVRAAPLDLQVGDPVTLTFEIRGSGNLESVTAPAVVTSDVLRVYPPQQTSAAAGAPGTREKVFEQVVIPQREGPLAIPEIRFSYFDPGAGVYRTSTHPPIALTVRPAAQAAEPPRIVGSSPAAPPPETLGRDIVFIKDAPGRLVPRGARLYRSVAFWAVQPLPILLWIATVLYDRRRRRLRGDVGYARFTRAGREARRALEAARAELRTGRQDAFYDTLARAMREYLSAKLDLPPGTVSADGVAERLSTRGISAELTAELRAFFATCEQVRFAPAAGGDGSMERTLERAATIIRGLERARLQPRAAAAILALVVALGSAGPAGTAEPPDRGGAAAERSPAAVFFHAGALYGEERYQDAAAEYERLLAGGYESGPVYFNLGNAYFKLGDVGRAVLSYERARRLAPRDPDVLANLAYARESSGDTDDAPLYARLLFPLAERLSADEILLLASAAYTLLVLALVVARLVPRLQRPARAAALGCALALVPLVTGGAYRLASIDLPRVGVVVARAETPVRFEPSASGTEHFRVRPGGMLRLLARREGWAQVARRDGARGWITQDALGEL